MSAYDVVRKPDPKPVSENPAVQQALEKLSPGAVDLIKKKSAENKDDTQNPSNPHSGFLPKKIDFEAVLSGQSRIPSIKQYDWEVMEIFGMGVPISPIAAVDYSVGTFNVGDQPKRVANSLGITGGAKIFNVLRLYYRHNRDVVGVKEENPTEITSHSGGFGVNAPFIGGFINVRANFDLGNATLRSPHFPFRLEQVEGGGQGTRPPEQLDKLFTFGLRAQVCGPLDFICAGYRHTFSRVGGNSLAPEDRTAELNRGDKVVDGNQFNLSFNLGALVDMVWLGWF